MYINYMFLEVLCKLGIFFPCMIQFEFSVYKQCAVVTNLNSPFSAHRITGTDMMNK